MFHNIFSRKRRSLTLKRSRSVKNLLLKGKIVLGYSSRRDTIILLIYIDGFKERTIRFWWTRSMCVVRSLEEICLYNLLKNCNLNDFKVGEVDQSLYRFVDEFISNVNQSAYLFCECPTWQYGSKLYNYCDWCLFYRDMVTYCAELNNISWSTRIIKIIRVLDLFYRIANYWNSVNRTVVDGYFQAMKILDHYVCRKL